MGSFTSTGSARVRVPAGLRNLNDDQNACLTPMGSPHYREHVNYPYGNVTLASIAATWWYKRLFQLPAKGIGS
ncbi:MAG: hypothetical protein IPM91_00110 [Bacteroidetes bacterium]|nr:hypothetical protein [Bacteroidota bacterium]